MNRHLPAYRLEAWAAGHRDAASDLHLEGCEACRAHVDALRAGRDALLTAHPRPPALRPVPVAPPAPWWRWLLPALVPAAVAAGVLLAWQSGGVWPGAEPAPETTRFKGAPRVAVIRARQGRQARLDRAVALRPGDALRFVVIVPEPAELTVGVLDAEGRWWLLARRHFPAGEHVLEEGLDVDEVPVAGSVLVGPPEALARPTALDGRGRAAYLALELTVEAPP